MQVPGSELQVMLDVADSSAEGPALGPSGFYEVDDVDAFLTAHSGITPVEGPTDLPPIRYASFRDPGRERLPPVPQPGADPRVGIRAGSWHRTSL